MNNNTAIPESVIQVFDFHEDWRLIKPHLHKPQVERALNRAMNECRALRARLYAGGGITTPDLDSPYMPQYGPLSCDDSGYWDDIASDATDAAIKRGEIDFHWPIFSGQDGEPKTEAECEELDKAMEKYHELSQRFYPKPDTMEFYQLHNAGHYLAPWLRELGKCVYPELKWGILVGDVHSTVYGADEIGSIKWIFDILNFDLPAIDILHLATVKRTEAPGPHCYECQMTVTPTMQFFKE
jgi:hypothetical protein